MTAIVSFPSMPAGAPPASVASNGGEWPRPDARAMDRDAAFRQLRHHTKNALQRIICHVATQPGLLETPAGRLLARDLERRIRLVADISDALFGLTHAPEELAPRLRGLGESVIELLCDPGQLIGLEVGVEGTCPAGLEEAVVRVAHELIGNAVKHGMHVRLVGHIDVRVRTAGPRTVLTVADDGWGYSSAPLPGEGLSVAQAMAEQHGGVLTMRRDRDRTLVSMTLPHRAARAAPRSGRA